MGVENTEPIGRRFMAQTIDHIAELDPDRRFCIIPKGPDCSDSFSDLTFERLAHAVNHMCWWIEERLGSTSSPVTLAYLGAHDIRYLIMVMACNKTGYQASGNRKYQSKAQVRLLEMTGCRKVAYSVERKQTVDKIQELFPGLQSIQIPSLYEMFEGNSSPYPFSKNFDEVKYEVAFIGHSSGTTGFPKPIRLTYGFFAALDHGAYVPIPPGRTAGVPDRLTPSDLILATTPFFHLMGFTVFVMAVFHRIPCVILPDRPVSNEFLSSVIDSLKPTAALVAPCILEDMSTSPKAMEALSTLRHVYYGGGPLASEIGNKICQRTKLINFIGMTEAGYVLSLVPQEKEDWSYFEWSPSFGIKMEPMDDGRSEMVIHRNEKPDLQPIFNTFPELDEYHTKDVYTPHPTKPGLWKFHGRIDDVIVLSNGQKFNPVTMEKVIEGHPLVSRAVVVGLARFQTALLVEPNWNLWDESSPKNQFIDEIWPKVREANTISPAYGRVMKNRIGLASRSKPFSTTPKGSTQRRLVTDCYKEEIDKLYTNPADQAFDYVFPKPANLDSITESVREIICDSTGLPTLADETDLYSVGFDSLQTFQLSIILTRTGFTTLTPQMIYAHPTVGKLSNFLFALLNGVESNGICRSENVSSLLSKYTAGLPDLEATKTHSVILTGSTGSLGTYLLHRLLSDESVAKVYCLNRSDVGERQVESFKHKGLKTELLEKAEFLTASLGKERLGLEKEKYNELIYTVDTIVHNSWRMDFNISLHSFEDQIQSVRRLIDFSLQSVRRAHFYFNSSIGAIGGWTLADGPSVPEELFDSCEVTLNQGYGQAKHVCERICHAASRAGVPTTILRLGQIAGPTTEEGAWNSTEWLPSIVATSKSIAKIPKTLGSMSVDWIPVDTLATIIIEIVESRRTTEAESRCSVFHLVNPLTTTWESLLTPLHERYAVQRVSMEEWIEELEKIQNPSAQDMLEKPALKLLPFYKSLVEGEGALSVPICVRRAREASKTMQSIGPISANLMATWINQWQF
ncbi:Non-canonical non-ribosomal peptide synthetase [Trichophyton interdigitale]|uniref:Non-canonical non-ribosomal peptide synthetase n=1 Tax=Trichophyton interdigitale TaxID=101480 RepID=A0A9P4YKP3_9EURO|nr:Non-canonical non-ribosomal peptide synthetase [Trichophyton interdigitale]KAF3900842.1 Non-canonical non-ribosomal peptide synthetase [Trichophyton interdigitale]KAG8211834.1 Non-canonical non-ribosomal peptide synthetase [Trichophyton interdigitale]